MEAGLQPARRRRRRGRWERLLRALPPYVALGVAVLLSLGVVRVVERGIAGPAQTVPSEGAYYSSEIDFTIDSELVDLRVFRSGASPSSASSVLGDAMDATVIESDDEYATAEESLMCLSVATTTRWPAATRAPSAGSPLGEPARSE